MTKRISGTLPDGSNYEYGRVFQRGVKEYNVPANVVASLNDSVMKLFRNDEKADRSGQELVSERASRWNVQVIKTYPEMMTVEEIEAEQGRSAK